MSDNQLPKQSGLSEGVTTELLEEMYQSLLANGALILPRVPYKVLEKVGERVRASAQAKRREAPFMTESRKELFSIIETSPEFSEEGFLRRNSDVLKGKRHNRD